MIDMMIRFINGRTGGVMYVDIDRKDEYIKAGHKLYAPHASEVKVEKPKPRQKQR